MGDSNGAWGDFNDDDHDLIDAYDSYQRLPDAGENDVLDEWCARKNISIEALVRVGARLSEHTVLAYAFPGGIKYRDLITGRRWNWTGAVWRKLKIIPAGVERSRSVIVTESETDAARLTILYPHTDVAVQPAGANPGYHLDRYAAQLDEYELVLLAHDNDRAGEHGASVLSSAISTKQARLLPPGPKNDWCSAEIDQPPVLPDPDTVLVAPEERYSVSLGEFIDVPAPEILSYFEQAILPVGSTLIVHGAMKSLKSAVVMDMVESLAQSEPWCFFEPLDEPQRVSVMQFEITPGFYHEYWQARLRRAPHPDLFRANVDLIRPWSRPAFVAGQAKHEDYLLRHLLERKSTIFVIDPIRHATGFADLNSEKEVRPLLNFFTRLNAEGITVIAAHHANKSGTRGGGGDANEMTGSAAFGGDAGSMIGMQIPRGYKVKDPVRNLQFLLRNAACPSDRSCRRDPDTGLLIYELDAVGKDEEPTSGSEKPPI